MRTHQSNARNAQESKKKKKKRLAAVAVAGVIGLATAGGAYSYWTSLGDGTGTATTGAGTAKPFTVTGNAATAMFPGDAAQTVTATIKNNGSESYKLQTLKAYITTNSTDCDSSNYKLNNSAAPSTEAGAADLGVGAVELAPGATTSTTFTMQFNDKATNQDACKGVAVTINYLAS